jgi:hypothetical protein
MDRLGLFTRKLLAFFVIAALSFSPLASPVAAAVMGTPSGAAMADDMPCCPHAPVSHDCAKCPLATLCMAGVFHGVPTASAVGPLYVAVALLATPQSDFKRDGLGYPPLPRPPRS